ncbi:MAG: MMPL family transporter [Phycisphaerae bacterium]|nr:MMPL family transporter [Phycisphaerae bacterium]
MTFSDVIPKYRWGVLGLWVLLAAGLIVLTPQGDPGKNEVESFLPADAPFRVASTRLANYFPRQHGLSQAVVFFERTDGKLTLDDQAYINGVALKFLQPSDGDLPPRDLYSLSLFSPGMIDAAFTAARAADMVGDLRGSLRSAIQGKNILSSATLNSPPNPLITPAGPNGQAAIVRVNIPSDFITHRTTRVVKHLRKVLAQNSPPAGLRVSVTGSAGYGHDYSLFVHDSHDRTIVATLIAVVLILLLVYRAPAAAFVPLAAISLAAVVVVMGIDIAQNAGVAIGIAERIFVFVLMYGAGIDYSLLYLSRYREFLSADLNPSDATRHALRATLPAIVASAATDAVGIFMLVFCRFVIFQTTGPAVAASLLVALLASITLVPALARIFGRRLYWPRRLTPISAEDQCAPQSHRVWALLAKTVTRKPGIILAVMLLVLAIPASRALKIHWVYDALAGIESTWTDATDQPTTPEHGVGNAAAGIETAVRHVPVGEIAPVTILIETTQPLPANQWISLSRKLTDALGTLPGVQNIRSLTQPLGKDYTPPKGSRTELTVQTFARSEYIGNHGHAMRLEAVMGMHTMSDAAMTLAETLRRTARDVLDNSDVQGQVYLSGATAQMNEIRAVTQRDFYLVVVLVLGVIFLIVLLLLRDWLLTAFMVGAIGVSYLATLGLCSWVFSAMWGLAGMDWKVQIFLFVVMAAVGVDYNIFLAARLSQEARNHPPIEAIQRAVIATGPVISSCGLIMAATLGSLMVGQVELLRQLGFAMGLGMLMDTFVIRTLLLPSFAALLRRTGQSKRLAG